MKLLVSVLEARVADRVADALVAGGFGVTRVDTVGGFLRRGNGTLLVGVENESVDSALALMRAAYAHGAGAATGGPVFVLDAGLCRRL